MLPCSRFWCCSVRKDGILSFTPLHRLVEVGFEKMVNELDVKEAARLGMHTRPLTTAVVQQHLADLGVDPEFGTHSHMRGLSGEFLDSFFIPIDAASS